MNAATNSTRSPSISLEIHICQYFDELKDPDNVTPSSLAAIVSVVVASILTCPLTIFLNALILVAFYSKPTLRLKANFLLRAMTVQNLVKGTIGYPVILANEIIYLMKHQTNCYLNVIGYVFTTDSDTLLTAINCERYLGLNFPVLHRVHVTERRLVSVAVVSFLVSLTSSLLASFVGKARFLLFSLILGSAIATFIFAVLIWRVILRRNQQLHPNQQNQSSASATSSERKAAKIATYVAISFLFTRIIPLVMVALNLTEQGSMNKTLQPAVIHYLSLLNSLINPLIFGLMNKNIKTACLDLIKYN